jgi:hypothetical protein
VGISTSTTRVLTLPNADVTLASTVAASTSVAGLMSAADKTKLDAVESSATADQSNAEIVAAVEAGTDSNTFTDADHTKLNAIEASADVTDATNVNAAGALMLSDTTTAGLGIVIDEDAMGSDSATKVPTQQSVVAYIASKIASSVTLKGNYDASADSPSLDDGTPIAGIVAGDHYVVSTAGTFFTEVLQAGDSIIAKQDSPTLIGHWITVNNNMVTPIVTAGIAADAVDGTKIADDAIDSEHYTDASIDLAHMSVNSIDSDQYVDASIDLAHLAADSVDGSKIVDDAINSEHYTDGSIDLAHMSVNSIDSDQYVDGSIDLAHMSVNSIDSDQYVDASIDLAHLAADSVDGTKIADDAIDSEHYTDASIDLAHMSANSVDSDQYVDASIDSAHLSSAINVLGTQQQWIPAGAWGAVETNGAEFAELELATNDIMLQTFDFDTTTSEKIQFWWHPASNWNAGTVTFQTYWTAASGTGTFIATLAGHSLADSDAIDAALGGTAATTTDTLITANDVHISPISSAVTINGATKNEPVVLQLSRDISDTLGVDAKLIGVKIIYTIDTATSS